MPKFNLGAAAVLAAFSAFPASAQVRTPGAQVRTQIQQDVAQPDAQITRPQQRESVSQREAALLGRQAAEVRQFNLRSARNAPHAPKSTPPWKRR